MPTINVDLVSDFHRFFRCNLFEYGLNVNQQNLHFAWLQLNQAFDCDEFNDFLKQKVIINEARIILERIKILDENTKSSKEVDIKDRSDRTVLFVRFLKALNHKICEEGSKQRLNEIADIILHKAQEFDFKCNISGIGAYISLFLAVASFATGILLDCLFPAATPFALALMTLIPPVVFVGLLFLAAALAIDATIIKGYHSHALFIHDRKDTFFKEIAVLPPP